MKAFFTRTIGIIALMTIGCFIPAYATDVCGNVSGIWTLAGSPYMVNCDLTIQTAQTLQIEPGVHVNFTGHYKLTVNGNLIAVGTPQDSIVFTRAYPTDASKWQGIRFVNSGNSCDLEYCLIEFGRAQGSGVDPNGGAIMTLVASPTVSHCTIARNEADNAGGGVNCFDGTAVFTDCAITNNRALYAGGVNCWHTSSQFINCTIAYNVATSGPGGGVSTAQSNPSFNSTIIAFSTGVGFVIGDTGYSPAIRFCDIYGNSGGDITNPNYGEQGLGQLNYTNFNGDPCDVYYNVFLDPAFASGSDYHLTIGSPCIDAADPSLPHDIDGTTADIGALPFLHGFLVTPSALDYGMFDLGMDSSQTILLYNATSLPISILSLSHASSAYSADTSGLNGAIQPHSTFHLNVTFAPTAEGNSLDTLVISTTQPDSVVRIPLSGDAEILLPPVDSLVIRRGSGNSMQLTWAAIVHTITGRPYTPPYYTIYAAITPSGPFVPIDVSPTDSYTHSQFNLQPMYFYQVTAGTGESTLQELRARLVKDLAPTK